MKLIKKIAAIMLSIMMVLGMASVVSAAESAETGTITIDKAISGQKYTIYKLLDLESYDKDNELYSYKPAAEWNEFFTTGEGNAYVDINENGYVTWKNGMDAAALAQKALAYAKAGTNGINTKKEETATGTTVTFSGLDLGYYLVDSSLGALCSLDTTNPTVTIKEKNGQPTVEKKVSSTKDSNYAEVNFANIGDKVFFQTIINAQAGAQNYVLHDTMCEGLTFNKDIQVKLNNNPNSTETPRDYSIYLKDTKTENKTNDECTFEIKFSEEFCKKLDENDKIYVTYSATLNGKAFIGMADDASGNTNTTHISYGENNTESNPSKTETYTLQIPVFKYTNTETGKKALAGAKFALYETETDGTAIALTRKNETQDYRKALTGESGITEIETDNTGKFNIQGLKPGTYWLEETAAPKGYNKLAKRIKVEITEYSTLFVNGKQTIDNKPITTAEVENKSGTILPSTGGMGTTVIYLAGALLVMISGVVLIAKKRASQK